MNGHSEDCDCNVCELEMLAEARRKRDAENRKAIYLEGKITGRLEAAAQCYQIATSHEFGFEAAKTIRETFKLEI